MPSKLAKLWKKKAWREEDTREALEGPVPPGTEAFPFEASLGARSTWAFIAHLIGLSLPSLLIAYFGYPDRLALALFTVGVAVSLASALYELQAGGRTILGAEEGIRLRRLLSETALPWWSISAIAVDPKLSQFRITSDAGVVRLRTAALSVDQRKLLVWAIRARAEQRGIPLSLDRSRRFALNVGAVALNMAGSALIVAAVYLTPTTYAGSPLGIRCSAAGQYLRTRFNAADHRGCVILRVSGAAERAGIHQGDLMIEMDGTAVTSGAQFSALFGRASGSHSSFTLLRPAEPAPLHVDVLPVRNGKAPYTPTSDALFYFLRARLDAASSKVTGPIADYTKAIELAPDFDLAYLYRGQLEEGQQDGQAAAFADYETALRLSPNLAEVQRQMALVYQNRALRDESVASAQRAIDLDGCEELAGQYNVDCAADYYTLSNVLHPSQYQAIAQAADRASAFDPGFSDAYLVAAFAYFGLGDRQRLTERAETFFSFPHPGAEAAKVSALQDLIDHPELRPEYPVTPYAAATPAASLP